MLVVRTTEDPADSVGELISAKQSLGLCNLAFGVNPLGLYSIEPWALGGQQARYYPNPLAAGFDTAVVGGDPVTHLSALVPACVVPDQEQGLLALRLEPVAAPLKKPPGYGAHGSAVDEPYPSLCKFRQIQPVAGEGLGVGIVLLGSFWSRCTGWSASAQECKLGRSKRENQLSSSKPKTHSGWLRASRISRSRPPFFSRIRDRGSLSSVWLASSAPQALPVSPGWSRH